MSHQIQVTKQLREAKSRVGYLQRALDNTKAQISLEQERLNGSDDSVTALQNQAEVLNEELAEWTDEYAYWLLKLEDLLLPT